jgi:hypothetical protein
MKATICKIKEVELQEENAKHSREEAAKADEKLTEMVEGLDNMIKIAKEANNEVFLFNLKLYTINSLPTIIFLFFSCLGNYEYLLF